MKTKKLLSLLLTLCMLLSVMPIMTFTVSAESPEFYAVYNTAAESDKVANTLSFYYDTNRATHNKSTERVYVGCYDGSSNGWPFDPTPNGGAVNWDNSYVRQNVKAVVIDPSVAYFTGLTTTERMFDGMCFADSIIGCEYLNVSNVTNMNEMFMYFGSKSTTINTVPDVSKWNTANVENMNSLFSDYAYSSTSITAVPDVSKWNTVKVTNMTGMFRNYAYSSTSITAVPDVSKWNTDNVTNMSAVFEDYAYSSTSITAVPDVSKWDTANVKYMNNMFKEYAYSSTSITAVPDVSKWNTANVTTMAALFENYAHSSTSITAVPDVSEWNVSKVTSFFCMFDSYAYSSTETLDSLNLTGWVLTPSTDLSVGCIFHYYAHSNTTSPVVYATDWSETITSFASGWNMFYGSKLKGNTNGDWSSANTSSTGCFTGPTYYTITCETIANGTVIADKTSACGGQNVTVTATPAADYLFDTITVNGEAISGNTFKMPEKNVTVSATFKPITHVSSVTLNPSSTALTVGENTTLTATVLPDDATYKTVIWSTSDENVATVSEGTVTAISEGTAKITATADGIYATCDVTVNPHEHSWTYSVSGDTFTASCSGKGTCNNKTATLSIVVPANLIYDGNAKLCTLSTTALGDKTDISADNIKYYVKGESTEMSGKPTEAGTYVAKLTINDVGTAELEFTIKALPVSLTIGSTTTWYTTVQGACDAAGTDTATVTLYNNMTENVTVNSGENITIDLNGYVLKSAANQKPVILNNGTLTVKSTNTERKHYFTEGSNKLWTWNGDTAVTDYVVTGGIITGGYSTSNDESKFGCGIRATSTLTLDHINIVGNTSTCGAGFRAKDDKGSSKYTMYDTVIAHNYSSGLCGGASLDSANGTFVMERCVISDNYAASNAGGIVVTGAVTLKDCSITDNYAGGSGGGLRLAGGSAKATIDGGIIKGNTSVNKGGGVLFENGISLTLKGNAVITGNTGESKTENLYLPSGKTATVSTPGGKMKVGVTLASGTGNVTGANGADYSMYFSSDNTSYTVKNDSNTVKLVSTSEISTDVKNATYSASLTLDADIDLTFTMGSLGTDGNGTDFVQSNLKITVDGTEWTGYTVENGVLIGTLASVAPQNICKDLHIVITYDGVTVKDFDYSVKSYCEAVFKAQTADKALDTPTGKYDTLADLCEALLNYGKYAEDYANGNTDSTINAGHVITFGDNYTFTGVKDASTFLGDYAEEGSEAYLTLGSTIKLNFVLKSCTEDLSTGYDENGEADKDNPQNFFVLNDKKTPEQIDPKRVKVTTDGDDTIVSIDLYASQLSTSYTLKLKGVETSKFCITYGVYNYCSAAQGLSAEDGFTDTVKTLCKAIHNYSVAVDAYIESTK